MTWYDPRRLLHPLLAQRMWFDVTRISVFLCGLRKGPRFRFAFWPFFSFPFGFASTGIWHRTKTKQARKEAFIYTRSSRRNNAHLCGGIHNERLSVACTCCRSTRWRKQQQPLLRGRWCCQFSAWSRAARPPRARCLEESMATSEYIIGSYSTWTTCSILVDWLTLFHWSGWVNSFLSR